MAAVAAAAVIGLVHKVLHFHLTLWVNSAAATMAAAQWPLPHKNKLHLQVSARVSTGSTSVSALSVKDLFVV